MNVLDSDLIIASLRNVPDAAKAMERLQGQTNVVTVITEMEVWHGENQRQRPDFARLEKIFNALPRLSFDSESARLAGRMWSELKQAGKEVDLRDVMIGATTIRHEAILYSRNVKHFERFAHLNIKRW